MSLEIPIRADIGGLSGDLNKAVKIVSDAGEKFAQSADKASKMAAGGTEAILASGKNLQQTYRALAKEAYQAGMNQGVFSQEALKAARAAGEIKKELDDAKIAINIMADDTPLFTSMGNALQGVAGAASIATGAMALMGGESEEIQKSIMKIQASLAILQGVQSLNKLNDSFAALKVVIMTNVIPAIAAMDMATKVTLIGAIAGAAIAIYGLTQDMNENAESAKRLSDANNKVAESQKAMQDAVSTARTANMKTLQLEIEAMKEGMAKEIELAKFKSLSLKNEAKERYESSQQTAYDIKRFAKEQVAIETILQNDLAAIRKKYAPKAAPKELVQTMQINAMGAKETLSNTSRDLMKNMDMQIQKLRIMALNIPPIIIPALPSLEKTAFMIEMKAFGESLVNLVGNIGSSAAFALGQALAGGEKFGESMKKQLANLMQQVGTGLIAMGIAYKATGIGVGYGAVLVGSGIALNIAAGALSASASSGGGSASSSGGSFSSGSPNMGSGFGDGFGGNSGWGSLSTRIEGQDLILATQRTGKYNRRG
jgi:hypothetical protein